MTLVSSEGRQVSAHKLVLTSCSEYFKTILKSSSNRVGNTILCLDNIRFDELNNMMDYVYNGAVNIEQEKLDRFLTIAQRFQLEGLISDENEPAELEEGSPINMDLSGEESKTEIIGDIARARPSRFIVKDNINLSSNEFQSIDELDRKIKEQLFKNDQGKYECRVCGKVLRDLTDSKRHAEVHIEGLSFPCQACEKTFRSRNSLRVHYSRKCNGTHISGQESH